MNLWVRWRNWLNAAFRRQRLEDEMDAELRFHVEEYAEDLVRSGVPREEALRRARLEFGGVERAKEECREARHVNFVDHLIQDLRYSAGMMRKNPGFTAVAVLTLALGIGSCTVVFSVFYNLLFNAFSARDASRLVVPALQDADNASQAGGILAPLTLYLADLDVVREQNQVFEGVVGYITAGGIVLANDGTQQYQFYAARVTSDSFEFYGVPALIGRGLVTDDGKPGAAPVFVMNSKTWKDNFRSDPRVVGKSFTVDGEPRTLVGIMPAKFQAFGPQEQLWIPVTRRSGTPRVAGEFPAEILARLKPGVSLNAASANLDLIVRGLAAVHPDDFPQHFTARVESATDALVGPSGGGPIIQSDIKHLLYDLLAAVMLLLLIACSNVANLLLAHASAREKEIAVRCALGATRGRLIEQLLVESSVLAATACLVGYAFAWIGTKIIAAVLPEIMGVSLGSRIGAETSLGLNLPVLLFSAGIAALTILICGLAPALHVFRPDLQPHLTGPGKGGYGSFRHGKLRAGLVIAEVALSIVLLTGAGLMMRSFFVLTHVDLGFNPQNVLLVVFLPPPSQNRTPPVERFASLQGQLVLRQVVERLKALPGVADVAIEDTIPGYGPTRGPEITVPGAAHNEEAGLLACDENFLHTLELRLTSGRWLTREEVQSSQYVAVISKRLARDFFASENPLGQRFKVKAFKGPIRPPQDAFFQIVGVVDDVKSVGPQQPAIPIAFIPFTVRGGFTLLLKTTVRPDSLTHAVREQVWAVDREEIIGLSSPLEDFLQKNTYATPEFSLLVSAPLAGIALALVVVGIFSVMAYTVSLETHEIGIRMALGAQRKSIVEMVLAKGARLIVSGIMIGAFASYVLVHLLSSQIWGVPLTDPWTFGGAIILITLAGLGACLLPARRAASVDPMVALRYE